MNLLKYKLRNFIRKKGILISRVYPKGLPLFMRKHFGDRELVGVEIGVEYGTNSLALLEKFNLKRLYLIDPYETYDTYNEPHRTKKTMLDAENFAKKLLKKYNERIIWIL